MKNNNFIKSIAFILWFAIFCPIRYYAETDKNIISTIKNASADFTYRILPADVKPLYILDVNDVDIKITQFTIKPVKANTTQIRNILKIKALSAN
ncbi:MAG TPA: hypothetical protein VN698_15755 [Bacteroidia bacterium]|nr:hypothetical protein [Bacteroidia bacterium]